MKKLLLLTILTLFIISVAISQEEQQNEHMHDHEEHHPHHDHEIGIANSVVYFIKEKEFAYGLHLHYTYQIIADKMGIGLAYERIFDEHKHNSLGIAFLYKPTHALNLNFTPGIAFEGSGFEEKSLALHFETSYEFSFHNTHIGPTFEVAWDQEDIHLSLGIHLGYGF